MWQLTEDTKERRVYTNSATGSRCTQDMCHTDKEGNKWWSFQDLLSLPYTRSFAATKVSSLYALGLSKIDLNNHIEGLKAVLKSDDKEKYEKAYALVIDFESKAANATDAVRQMTALVCVYFTLNDEPIDSFENSIQLHKMGLIENDPNMHNFFLKRQIDLTEQYTAHLKIFSQTALAITENGK